MKKLNFKNLILQSLKEERTNVDTEYKKKHATIVLEHSRVPERAKTISVFIPGPSYQKDER